MENMEKNREKISNIQKKDKLNSEKIGKIQKKIVKRYGKYKRKHWLAAPSPPLYFHNYIIYFNNYISYKRLLFSFVFSISFHNFLLYFPYLFTIQLIFLLPR
jgi:hypothetical protein